MAAPAGLSPSLLSSLETNGRLQEPVEGAFFLHVPGFLQLHHADALLSVLRRGLPWQHLPVRVFGKTFLQPRLTHFEADEGIIYRYAGLTLSGSQWCPELFALKKQIEERTGWKFNAVLCNQYRSGQDAMGWHADDEPELGPLPAIASLSLGGPRDFSVRLKRHVPTRETAGNLKTLRTVLKIPLAHGDLLLMWGASQELTQHCIPRSRRNNDLRLNLTYRRIMAV